MEMPQLSAVACSVLDARSPEQFVFIPDWMMKALRLRPRREIATQPACASPRGREKQKKALPSDDLGLAVREECLRILPAYFFGGQTLGLAGVGCRVSGRRCGRFLLTQD